MKRPENASYAEWRAYAIEVEAKCDAAVEALRAIIVCTADPDAPDAWHVKQGRGKDFGRAIREGRSVLAEQEKEQG